MNSSTNNEFLIDKKSNINEKKGEEKSKNVEIFIHPSAKLESSSHNLIESSNISITENNKFYWNLWADWCRKN